LRGKAFFATFSWKIWQGLVVRDAGNMQTVRVLEKLLWASLRGRRRHTVVIVVRLAHLGARKAFSSSGLLINISEED